MATKLFMIACEPSGDGHGASLIEALKHRRADLEFRGLGGPRMKAQGMPLLHDMTTLSALGFGDVLRQYLTYRRIFYAALKEAQAWKPDAIILIDSPAFNLRFAKKIKNIPVIYYISPQFWAWGKHRIRIVKKKVRKMIAIFPFEKKMYDEAGVVCDFVGHPLLDHTDTVHNPSFYKAELGLRGEEHAIGLFPGSRTKEITRIFPLMLETATQLKRIHSKAVFYYQPSNNVPTEIYDNILKQFTDIEVHKSSYSLHRLMAAMDFALITSGTTTLEAALIGLPYFLFYKASWSTYHLGRHLIRVPYLGIVNLLAERAVVPEFIQDAIQPASIAKQAKQLLETTSLYQKMKRDFLEVKAKLGTPGASERAAESVLQVIEKTSR